MQIIVSQDNNPPRQSLRACTPARESAVSTTRRGMHADVPAEDVVIERAYLKDAE